MKVSTQTCNICSVLLTEDNAYKKSGRDTLLSWCKTCFNRRTWERVQRNKEKAVRHKGGKCIRCGYSKSIWALEFHHRNRDEKNRKISRLLLNKWEIILEEIEKCDLVCANCHREIEEEIHYALMVK